MRSIFAVSRAASQQLGILRKSWQVFHDRLLLGRCFRDFVLPVFEYCSAVWCSAADTHLRLLDRVVSGASFFTGVCFRVTLHIVDLFQYYVCCTRSGVIRCSSYAVCVGAGYTRCCDSTSVHLCAFSLQNLTVSPDFCALLCVSVERS